jgi:hypothetical protein
MTLVPSPNKLIVANPSKKRASISNIVSITNMQQKMLGASLI